MMDVARYRGDPVGFMQTFLYDPNTGHRFRLYKEQEQFIRWGFTLTDDGRLPFPEMLFSAPKKSGKTTLAAMCALYVIIILANKFGEIYLCANDLEQSVGRVFTECEKIIEASPMLAGSTNITADTIEFPHSRSFIKALPSDWQGAAGTSPNLIIFDELWAYTSESARRLWDEMVPTPTRKVSARLTVTYAGFTGESTLLEELLKRGQQGTEIAA